MHSHPSPITTRLLQRTALQIHTSFALSGIPTYGTFSWNLPWTPLLTGSLTLHFVQRSLAPSLLSIYIPVELGDEACRGRPT